MEPFVFSTSLPTMASAKFTTVFVFFGLLFIQPSGDRGSRPVKKFVFMRSIRTRVNRRYHRVWAEPKSTTAALPA